MRFAPIGGPTAGSLVIVASRELKTRTGIPGETSNEQAREAICHSLAVGRHWIRPWLARRGSTRGNHRHRAKTRGVVPRCSVDNPYDIGGGDVESQPAEFVSNRRLRPRYGFLPGAR